MQALTNKLGTITRELLSPILTTGVIPTLILTIILGQWLRWLLLGRLQALPPGPFPLPILGNLLHLITLPLPHLSLTRLAHRYGPIVFLRLGSFPTIIISNASVARQVLLTHDKTFASRPRSEAARRLLYGQDKISTLSPYGPEWRFNRKFYNTHLLNAHSIQEIHVRIVVPEVRSLILRLHASMVPSTSTTSTTTSTQSVNLTTIFYFLMENIVSQITFSEYASNISVPNSAIAGHSQCNDSLNLANLILEGSSLFSTQLVTDIVPLLGFVDYSAKRAMDRWFCSMDAVMEAILSKREADIKSKMCKQHQDSAKETTPVRDILDVLVASEEPPLSRDKKKAMMLELFAAGIDTTSRTLDWAMAEVLLNPRVLRKLQEEVDCVAGKERMLEMADLPKLEYTKAVVKETFRKHTTVPLLLPHLSMEDCELQVELSCGNKRSYHIPSGTRVLVNAWAISNDPMTWKDPSEFVPERFLGAEVDVRGQHFELLPFGSGRRMCPGMGLALGVLELTLASLAHCFEWEVPMGHPIDMRETFSTALARIAPLYALPTKFRLPYHLIARDQRRNDLVY